MEYLLYFPLGTSWELAFFIGLVAGWFVSDYVCNSKPKRSKRTERQIFDGHGEVEHMMYRAVVTERFASLDIDYRHSIIRLINNRYQYN